MFSTLTDKKPLLSAKRPNMNYPILLRSPIRFRTVIYEIDYKFFNQHTLNAFILPHFYDSTIKGKPLLLST